MLSFPAGEELSLFPFPVQCRTGSCSSAFALPEHFQCGFPEPLCKQFVLCRSGGQLDSPPHCHFSQRERRCFQTGPSDPSGTRMLWRLLLWLEAGISISSDWQGGIKLLNGPNGFWLGLMTIILTIPVTSMAHSVNTRLIFEGCICTFYPVIINPHSLQQHHFIVNSCNLQQRYFIMKPYSLQQCLFQQHGSQRVGIGV